VLNHEELYQKLDSRLTRIENKLDTYLENSIKNTTNITWLQGYVKVSLSLFITLIGATATALFKIFTK